MGEIKKIGEQSALQLFNPGAKIQSQEDLDKLEIRDLQAKESLQARLQKTLRQELSRDLGRLVAIECFKAQERIGQNNLEPERAEIIQEDVLAHLKSKCFNWTANEVVIALRMGALGELGEPPRHLTSQNVIQWLKAYDEQVRKKATRELKRASERALLHQGDKLLNEPSELTGDQKKQAILDQFKRWERGDQILGATLIFKLMTELKILNISKEARWEYISKAGEVIEKEAKEAATNPVTRTAARQRLDKIKSMEIGKAATVPEFIKTRAQELAIVDHFMECKEKEMSPLELLED